jgi:hypothetical protein
MLQGLTNEQVATIRRAVARLRTRLDALRSLDTPAHDPVARASAERQRMELWQALDNEVATLVESGDLSLATIEPLEEQWRLHVRHAADSGQ